MDALQRILRESEDPMERARGRAYAAQAAAERGCLHTRTTHHAADSGMLRERCDDCGAHRLIPTLATVPDMRDRLPTEWSAS